ncbi:MAG: EAL domain-containing protein, partial [Leptolyngbyaceae bacterium]|nr:EAL domain-containing protein [Leptolyngbyaceae bacterium]
QKIHSDDLEAIQRAFEEALHEGKPYEFDYRIVRPDGSIRHVSAKGQPTLDADGKAVRLFGTVLDITDRKQKEEELKRSEAQLREQAQQLEYDALHDGLTGLHNRALLMDRLHHAMLRTQQHGSQFAVLFLDLDRFKVVNDSVGHLVGDQLLVAIARRLETCTSPSDTVARLGGDEFVILLEDIEDINQAIATANRIQRELKSPLALAGRELFITASVGIALSDSGYKKPEELLRDADIAMYRAKALGKARYEVFDTIMHTKAVQLLQLETDLRRAIFRTQNPLDCPTSGQPTQQLHLHYQPIMALATQRIVGFEALVRWQHPSQGLVYPQQFIPMAEETGLIIPIDHWALWEACHQLCLWQTQFLNHPPLSISVNLSSKQFSQPDLISYIDRVLEETGINPSSLKLEITESAIMDDAETAINLLLQLKNRNIQICMDDFGIGYSSLNYLHRFPIDTLKIDRSFVNRLGRNSESAEIIQAIITLAHSLDMDVVAEGIEVHDQVAQLRVLQCEHGQGYFFSKPLNSEAAQALLIAEEPTLKLL